MPEIADLGIEPDVAARGSVTPKPRSSLKAKLKLLGFALVVVIGECLLAYFYIPTTSAPGGDAAPSGAGADAKLLADLTGEEQADSKEQKNLKEVDLGEFSITSYQPISATTLRIDCHLFGTVNEEDKEEFDLLYPDKSNRIRDEVITIFRSSEFDDIADPELGLIKRKILEKTNQILDKPFVQTIMTPDFSFNPQ